MPERKAFVATNWYWSVAGSSQTQVYSSVSGDYVPLTDQTFVAWEQDGTLPTDVASEALLGQLLSQYLLRPVNANILDGYTTALATNIVNNPIYKILFNHENRIRTEVENKVAMTPAQALAAVKALV